MGTIKDGFKGATEGLAREASIAGINAVKVIVVEGAEAIKPRIGGLGPADEAKSSLALGTLEEGKRKIIINFLQTLSKGERNWFRRVIAEMDLKNASIILAQYADLPDDEERKKRGEASGLIKSSLLEKINLKGFAEARDFWAKKMENDIEERR